MAAWVCLCLAPLAAGDDGRGRTAGSTDVEFVELVGIDFRNGHQGTAMRLSLTNSTPAPIRLPIAARYRLADGGCAHFISSDYTRVERFSAQGVLIPAATVIEEVELPADWLTVAPGKAAQVLELAPLEVLPGQTFSVTIADEGRQSHRSARFSLEGLQPAAVLRRDCNGSTDVAGDSSDANRVEDVFARGDFHPHIPMLAWVEETYGKGRPVAEGHETGSAYRIAGQDLWLVFVRDEAQGEFAAIVEYRIQAFAPDGAADAPALAMASPTLAGVAIGAREDDAAIPDSFESRGFVQLGGETVQLYEQLPTAADSMTFLRIYVQDGVVVGLSVLASE